VFNWYPATLVTCLILGAQCSFCVMPINLFANFLNHTHSFIWR